MVLGSYANLYATEEAIAKGESAELKVAPTFISLSDDSKGKLERAVLFVMEVLIMMLSS